MHEVAVATSIANIFLILPTCSFAEIRDRRKVNNDGSPCIKPSVKIAKGISSVLFFSKLDIHITHHVVSKIITDI